LRSGLTLALHGRQMRITTILLALLVAAPPARSQTTQPSPSPATPALFTQNDAIWSAAFLVGSLALSREDLRITRSWTDSTRHNPERDRLAKNFARIQEGTLTVGNLALWGVGRLLKAPALADVTFHAAEAVVLGSVAAQLIRGPLGRTRPWANDFTDQYEFHPFQGFTNFKYRAFPSIHTVSSFAVATVYTLETQRHAPGATWIVAPVSFVIAAGPALARLYNGQHWASDLLAGAFLGTLAGAKVVRYNHDVRPDNRVNRFFLGKDNVKLGASGGNLGFTWTLTF
jgi:membrane-associated phospholipid phosphatase